jgi:hypothetical protein
MGAIRSVGRRGAKVAQISNLLYRSASSLRRLGTSARSRQVRVLQAWGNQAVYVVSFKDPEHFSKLYIRDDGTVVSGSPKGHAR